MQNGWVWFDLKCKYDVGGMKPGGPRGVGGLVHRMCILVQAWRLGWVGTKPGGRTRFGSGLDLGTEEGMWKVASGKITRMNPSARYLSPDWAWKLDIAQEG